MSTHNIGFYEDLTKLSLNYHQIRTLFFLLLKPNSIGIPVLFLCIVSLHCSNAVRYETRNVWSGACCMTLVCLKLNPSNLQYHRLMIHWGRVSRCI